MKTLNDFDKYKNDNNCALYSNIEIEHLDVIRKLLKESKITTKVFFRGKNRRKVVYSSASRTHKQCLKKDAQTFSVYKNDKALEKKRKESLTDHERKRKELKTEVLYLTHEIYELILNSDYSDECNQFVLAQLEAFQHKL